jgi:rod shape-determining protein MreC
MRNLFQIILRFHFQLLYFVLMVVSLLLLLNSNEYHETTWFNSSSYVTGKVYNTWYSVRHYFSLSQENERLAMENYILKNMLKQNVLKADSHSLMADGPVQYHYYPAVAINKSVNRQKNFITLNVGSLSGVEPEMGVVAPDGVVGIVRDVSPHFSTVIPVINTGSHLSAKIRGKEFFGTISWEGPDYRTARMNEIPFHVPIEVGDIIETSGYSAIFPKGITVGIVKEVSRGTDDYFLDIKIILATDFLKVNHVMVIRNNMRKEQKELEQITGNG